MREIYLDAAATTRPYKEVADVVYQTMLEDYGNASANYTLGEKSRSLIEEAREYIAADINCEPDEIIFTSGACEANSLAFTCQHERALISQLEHKSIQMCAKGCCGALGVDTWGRVLPDVAGDKWHSNTCLLSIQGANGEIGTIQDMGVIRYFFPDCVFHSDMTQLFPEQRIDVKQLGLDMMSVSAQKFHGPKGVGFLYVKKGIELSPIIYGSQENGLRGGTYNTPLIAGMYKALQMTRERSEQEQPEIRAKRDALLYGLLEIPHTYLNGVHQVFDDRLNNNISLLVEDCNAEQLITLGGLYGIYFNNGSACNNGSNERSRTLSAIGLLEKEIDSTIRITIDNSFRWEDIDYTVTMFKKMIDRVRTMPSYDSK